MVKTPENSDRQTILLVDDDAHVLMFVSVLLADEGIYDVLSASSAAEAIQIAAGHEGNIDLLLSDFQMPGMSGVDLASALSLTRPKIKVLLMSEFPAGMLVLNEGWHFLPKPFINSQLRALVYGLLSPKQHSRLSR